MDQETETPLDDLESVENEEEPQLGDAVAGETRHACSGGAGYSG